MLSISARRGETATISATASVMRVAASGDQVTSQARPSGPCSAWTRMSTAAYSTGVTWSATTTTSEGPAKADGTPTRPSWATSRLATDT